MLGAVHVSAAISVGVALLLACGVLTYWVTLGAPEVPVSRRRIRRLSLILMLAGLFCTLCGASFFDPEVPGQRLSYAYSWTLALASIVGVVLTAVADFVNSLRLHLGQQARVAERTAEEVMRQLLRKETGAASPPQEE